MLIVALLSDGLKFLLYFEQSFLVFFFLERWDWFKLFLKRESSDRHYFSILFQTIIILSEGLTDMIYMRDRTNKKKTQGQELTKRLILDELKYKITRQVGHNHNKQSEDKANAKGENEESKLQRPKYQIFKKDPQNKCIEGLSSQRFVESIVVDSKANIMTSGCASRKKNILTSQKCFDIQIVNMQGSKLKFQTYIKLLEDENKELKGKMESLAMKFDQSSSKLLQMNEKNMKQIQQKYDQESTNISDKDRLISKYQRSFEQGKSALLSASMELIQAKNNLGMGLSVEKMALKRQDLARCLEKTQKMISVYSDFLQEGGRNKIKESFILEELNSILKCQQKTIEKLTQNKKNDGELYRENVLLRYEANRLSNNNEELLLLLSEVQKEKNNSVIDESAPKKREPFSSLEHLSFSNSNERERTPIDLLTDPKSQSSDLLRIQQGESHIQNEQLWKSQLSEKESRINNLQIQKQFISDQLISLEKDLEDLQRQYKIVNEEKKKALNEVEVLREDKEQLKREIQVSEQQENVLNDQISLLKEKIRHLEERGEQVQGVQVAKSRYVSIPDQETVTIETILKFFKKKELNKYHQALMDLISQYEFRISELNNSFKQEKETKDKLFAFGRGLYSMVSSGRSFSLENLVLEISKYEEIVNGISDNEIDVLLRQIKSYTIGVDRLELENIVSQLQDYVYHLKTRMPTLSEEYFQDGSSVSDSLTYAQRQDL